MKLIDFAKMRNFGNDVKLNFNELLGVQVRNDLKLLIRDTNQNFRNEIKLSATYAPFKMGLTMLANCRPHTA